MWDENRAGPDGHALFPGEDNVGARRSMFCLWTGEIGVHEAAMCLVEFSLEIHSEVSKNDLPCPRQNLSVQDARPPPRLESWTMVTMTDMKFRKITPANDSKHGN